MSVDDQILEGVKACVFLLSFFCGMFLFSLFGKRWFF